MKDGPNIARVAAPDRRPGARRDPDRAPRRPRAHGDRARGGRRRHQADRERAPRQAGRRAPARGRGAGPAPLLPPRRQRRRPAPRVADGRRLSHRRGPPRHRAARAGAAEGPRLLRPPRRRARRARLRRPRRARLARRPRRQPLPHQRRRRRARRVRHRPGAARRSERRTFCRPCLDWGERRHHLGGALGAALLDRLYALRWARRAADSRVVVFTPRGEQQWRAAFAA